MKENKNIYKKFCDNNDVPLFSQYWWLDAVSGENWDVVIVKKGDEILATMPYHTTKKFGFKMVFMPILTQTMGPYVKYASNLSQNKKISFEKKVFNQIIDALPKTAFFFQNFHYSITNWQPFYWAGYKQSTYYTYIIKDIKNHENVLSSFSSSKRSEVKKASKKLKIDFELNGNDLYNSHVETLNEKNQKITYSRELLNNIIDSGSKKGACKVLGIRDENDSLLCCMLIAWDNYSAYNLITSINSKSRKQGAASMMFYEAIKYVSQYVNVFDFEGSMVESIENSYRQFGTVQVPYFRITKANNIVLKIAESLK